MSKGIFNCNTALPQRIDNISLQDYHYINKSAQRGLGKSEFARRKVEVSSDESRTLLGGKSEAAYRA